MHLKVPLLFAVASTIALSNGVLQAKPDTLLSARTVQPTASPVPAKTEWVEAPMTIAADARLASVKIPASASQIIVERKDASGKWSTWVTSKIKSGTTTQSGAPSKVVAFFMAGEGGGSR
jgi:hypothetical protein